MTTADLHAACDAAWAEVPFADGGSVRPITADCMDAVGDAAGVAWDTFGEWPHDVGTATTSAELTVQAVLGVTSPQNLDLDALLGPGAPPAWREDLLLRADALATTPTVDALYFDTLYRDVHRITYDADATWLMAIGGGHLVVGPLAVEAGPDNPLPFAYAPFAVAAVLVHELAHITYRDAHDDCDGASCDASPDGAYGVSAWWTWVYLDQHRELLANAACTQVIDALWDACTRIADTEGFVPCSDQALHADCWDDP